MFLLPAEYSVHSNVRGLSGSLSNLTVTVSQYDILSCSKTLLLDIRHMSELLAPGLVSLHTCLLPGQDASSPRITAYERDGYGELHHPKFECGHLKNAGIWGFVVQDRIISVLSLPQPWPKRPDLWMFSDINGSRAGWGVRFVGDLNVHNSQVVGFYDHESSRCCRRNKLQLAVINSTMHVVILLNNVFFIFAAFFKV